MNIQGFKVNFLGDSITEGLHFNDAGYAVIAQRLKEFIDSL